MTISNRDLLRKATLTTTDMTAQGTSLTLQQATSFLRLAITPQVMLPDVRTVTSSAAKWQEAHIAMDSRIMRPGVQATRLSDADRVEPSTGQIEINTVLLRGEIPVSDEVMEDNIEQAGFGTTIMTMIADAAGRDFEELMISGSTSSSDSYLAQTDGWLARCQGTGANIYSAAPDGQDYQTIFLHMLQMLPSKYKRDRANMRFYVPVRLDENYRAALAGRGSPLGDALLTGTQPLVFQDVPIVPVPLWPVSNTNTSYILLTHRLNLYAGFHRTIRIETFRDPREGATSWVVTARIAPQVGYVPSTVTATGVAV